MRYSKKNEIIEIETEEDIHYFFKAFKAAADEYDNNVAVYSGTYNKNTCFDTLRGDCASMLYTTPNCGVFYGEIFCNSGKFYASARKYYYDTDNFTRDEVMEIAEHIYTYWGVTKDVKDEVVLNLVMKKALTDSDIRMLVGSIFENNLEVSYDGHEASNFLPRVIDKVVEKGDEDDWDMVLTLEFK